MLIFIIGLIGISLLVFFFAKPSIGERKTRLMNLYSSVLSDMAIDFRDGSIHNTNIHDISRSIENLATEIERTATGIHTESLDNQKWFAGIITEFNAQLRMWIDRHTDELETIEGEIRGTESDKNSEKAVLELAYMRLDTHRRVFEKI